MSVRAQNKKGTGPARRIVVQSSGRPATPTNVVATAMDDAGDAAEVTVTWSHGDWEGPAGTYVVRRSDGRVWRVAASVRSVRESIPYNGKSYTWVVNAINGTASHVASHTSRPATSAPYRAVRSLLVRAGRTGNAVGQPGCSHSSCAYITGSTQNFAGTVTCRVNSSTGNGGFISWTQGGNEQNHRSPNYFGVPGGWVTVTCDGVTSDRYYW